MRLRGADVRFGPAVPGSHALHRAVLPALTRPGPRGRPPVVSGIIYVIRHGLQWKDAPGGYGPYKTLYNRFIRWSRLGVFARIFAALAAGSGVPERLMIDATHLKAHRTAASLLQKGAFAGLAAPAAG